MQCYKEVAIEVKNQRLVQLTKIAFLKACGRMVLKLAVCQLLEINFTSAMET